MSDLDVLILGGYYGTGRNKHEITSFLVGVKHDHKNKYLSFAKIGTGLGFKELLVIKEKLSEHWLDITGKEHEHGVYFAKEVPDKWIKPENSCCLQVRGSELTKLFRTNPDYKAEYTLRFPRILKIRPDKPYYSCLTVSDLSKLTQSSQSIEKLNKRHLEISDLLIGSPAKKKLKNQVDAKRKDVQRKSDILASLEFVVLSGLGDWTKEIVENDILENGGKVALDVNENCTFCMLMGDKHLRTETYKGNVDIVKVEWLQRVLDEGEFINYTLFDVIYKSSASEFQFKQNCDKFGDFYTYPATKRSINHILKNKFTGDFAKENYLNLTVKEVRDFYKEIKLRKEYQRCLLGYTAYFDFFKVFNDPTSILISKLDFTEKIDFRLRGGQVSLMLNSECDCIIACPDRFDEVQHYLKTVPCEIPIFASTPLFVDYLARLENS